MTRYAEGRVGWDGWKKASERGWGWDQRRQVLSFFAPLLRNMWNNLGNEMGTFVRAGTPYYTDPSTGLLTAGTANTPRFEEYGILLEPGGTNLCLQSAEFDTTWSATRSSVDDQAADAPDGNTTADKLIEDDTASNTHFVRQTIAHGSFTDDADVTFSVYAKQGDRTWICLQGRNKSAADKRAWFDLANGAVGTESGATGVISSAPNGFYRCSITYDVGSDASPQNISFFILLADADNSITYSGDSTTYADGVYLWGAQVEEFPVPTSYIATTTAAASRTTESTYPTWTLPTGVFDALGTAVVWWRPGFAQSLVDANGGIISVRDHANSLLRTHSSNGSIRSWDGTTDGVKDPTYVASTWYKLIVKWGYDVSGSEKMRVGVDSGSGVSWGTEVAFDGAYTVGTYLRLAYGLFGPMHIKNLRIYNKVLTDTQIDKLGSP